MFQDVPITLDRGAGSSYLVQYGTSWNIGEIMSGPYYTAQKSRLDGRQAFSVTFRHPLRTDSRGKPGLKVRRGLGTSDEKEADRLVAELETLLSDERYWSIAAKADAAQRFSDVVVKAFYSGLEAPGESGEKVRDTSIPLPGPEDGYTRILLVGTTGAGKTTLLRQLIGTHPTRDRFPSTSPGKTTVADLEVVTSSDTDYRGIVTFLPERAVRAYVQECVTAACLTARKGHDDTAVARDLLQHADQRFRMHYVLGEWPTEPDDEEEWGFEDEDSHGAAGTAEEDLPSASERAQNAKHIADWVARIRQLTEYHAKAVASVVGFDWEDLSADALEAAEGMLTVELEGSDQHGEIVLEILDQILARFELIGTGEISKSTTGWPTTWQLVSADREAFLRSMRWFSSNYAPRYGRLVTPLVQAMRVRGPFRPELEGVGEPRLVLIDGQGLGHTPDSASSVTTNITSRFPDVDVILLVDNATQPMQAAPLAVVRAVATGGFQEKLAIAFTHFDHVRGANVVSVAAKREHVLGAARNVLNTLRGEIGATLIRSLEQGLESQCFMLGWLDRPADTLSPKMREQLVSLFGFFEAAIAPAEPIPASPVYDPASVLFAVQAAARDFQARWDARLGFGSVDGVQKAHWATVKALNRRIADGWQIEYRQLMPVADLFSRLSEEISRFLEEPVRWNGDAAHPVARERAISAVRREVAAALQVFARDRIIQQHVADWVRAYDHGGPGSTFDRARDIKGIYEEAAPVPGSVMTDRSRKFLEQVRQLVHAAVIAGGGEIAGDLEAGARIP